MTKLMVLHPDDTATLQDLRVQLRRLRQADGVSGYELCRRLGQHVEFVSNMERGKSPSPNMSTLQFWARGLQRRLEFSITNFWLMSHRDQEMLTLYAQSRPWDSDPQLLSRFMVAAARQLRVRRGIDVSELAAQLEIGSDAVRRWEDEPSATPSMARLMWQVRCCGLRVQWQLFTKDEWIFG